MQYDLENTRSEISKRLRHGRGKSPWQPLNRELYPGTVWNLWRREQDTPRTYNVMRSRNVYTSSAILIAWYYFTRTERFYGDLMSPATITRTIFIQNARYLYPISIKFGISRQIFIKVPNIRFHGNPPSGCRADTCGQKGKQMDGHDECNRRFSRLSKRA